MSLNTLTDTYTKGNLTVELVKDAPDGVVRYFDFDHEDITEKSNLDIHIRMKFPYQSLDPHHLYINLSELREFLDEDELHKEHIENLSFNRFECFLCMGGEEKTLHCHDKTRSVHFHKSCYKGAVDCINKLLKTNPITIQSEERLTEI